MTRQNSHSRSASEVRLPPPPPDIVQTPTNGHKPAVAAVPAEPPEVDAARTVVAQAASLMQRAPAFQQLDRRTQNALVNDLSAIQQALNAPVAQPLETPFDRRRPFPDQRPVPDTTNQSGSPQPDGAAAQPNGPKAPATETLAKRAGALSDEIDFPAFVAGLVHGTFDAIVDASIRQMETFANLVSAVAKDVDEFTQQNVTPNQVRDHLAQQYPKDLVLQWPDGPAGQPVLSARAATDDNGEPPSPDWLRDYGLEGEPLTDELIEQDLIPQARRHVGQDRQQLLATMVLLGMNRVVVRDGTISAKVRFRAAAKDTTQVNYAVSSDPGSNRSWGERGSSTYDNLSTMVSTVGVNVQADTDLKVELFGEVKLNFASETLPLDRFVDTARLTLLQQNAHVPALSPAGRTPAVAPGPAPTPTPLPPATTAPPQARP